jgi:TetR/AcrR family transcriptional regulator
MPATASSARNSPTARKGGIRRANEARILRAAERVFAKAGFAGARMAEIAAAAGVPKANLHY